jgi:hypothetical protein
MLDIRSIQAASGAQCVQLGTSREPPQHSLGKVVQRSDAGLHGYIVLMAETIVPPPMHPLRPVREGIENPQLPAQQFPNFLRIEDQALSGSRLPCRIRVVSQFEFSFVSLCSIASAWASISEASSVKLHCLIAVAALKGLDCYCQRPSGTIA